MGMDDSPELHLADTLAAGAGLVDEGRGPHAGEPRREEAVSLAD